MKLRLFSRISFFSALFLLSLCLMPRSALAGATGGGGGQTTTTTTSTTQHETHTRVDLPPIQAFSTRLLAETQEGTFVYDSSFDLPFTDPLVQAAVAEARTALEADAAPDAVTITGPELEATGTTTSASTEVDQVLDHTETSVTTSTTFGPATILIGEDQSQTFFVAAGTLNVNTNTHTESFINDEFQATQTLEETYLLFSQLITSTPPLGDAQGGGIACALSGSSSKESGLLFLGLGFGILAFWRIRFFRLNTKRF